MALNPENADKAQLGMGGLYKIIQSGTNVMPADEDWSFLEVQPDTVITGLKFTPDKTGDEETVSAFNITNIGVLLIPPVYKKRVGKWTEVSISDGQINIYGLEPFNQ